jgi:hypothetical protein
MRSVMSFKVLVSRMDIHQARTLTAQAGMKAKMDSHYEKVTIMKAGKEKTEAMSEACLDSK